MRLNTWVTLGASAAFGVMAVFLARGWINDAIENEFRQAAPVNFTDQNPTVAVLVARADMGFGSEITPDMLRLAEFPEDAIPAGAYHAFEDLFVDTSQRTIVLSRISMNEAIIDYRISGPGAKGSLSALITEGMRAVAVRVNDVAGVAGFIVPGDYVDVVYTRDEESRRNGNTLTSDVLLQNVKVLGIDQNLNDQSAAPDVAKTVTLEVTNQDAQKLHLGMDAGKLSLTLRRSGEMTIEPSRTVEQRSLIATTKPRVKKRRAYKPSVTVSVQPKPSGVANVTIIRGDERDEVSVVREDIPADNNNELAGG